MYEKLFLSEHYTIIQGAENLKFCMIGEVSIDKIKAGRAVCHVQTASTMMRFIIFMECKGTKWTQMKVAKQFLSRLNVPNLFEVG